MTAIHRTRAIDHPSYGRIMIFDDEDYISRIVGSGAEWEPEICELMARRVEPGGDVLDVGANIGLSALGILKRGAKPRAVHCFEPRADSMALLQYNLRDQLAGGDVEAFGFALSSEPIGVHRYAQTPGNIAGTQMGLYSHEFCASTTLDEVDQRGAFQKVSLIKIDVEMHEGEMLEGARGFFRAHRPVMFIEVCDHLVEARAAWLRNEIGYVLERHLGGWDYIFAPST